MDRSPQGNLLAIGDDNHNIKLFKYPCIRSNSVGKVYKGHSAHVLNVRFSNDGKLLYSVGGSDKAIMQFDVKK